MNTNANIKQGYKRTSLGILPQEWEVVRLGEVGDIVGGGTPDTTNSAFWNGEILWLTPTEIKQKYIFDSERKITQKGLSNSSAKLLPKNTILITTRATIGDIGIATQQLSTNQGFQSFIGGEKVNFEFMYYLLGAKKREFITLANGSTFLEISAKTIRQIQIPLPPLAEQEKIAQILGVWDKGISVLKSLIEAKTKRKKALMQRLLTPPCESLTPSLRASKTSAAIHNKSVDCHDLTASNLAMTEKNSKAKQSLRFAEFTDKWQEMRLGDICENRRGSFPQPYGLKKWYGGDEAMPFVQVIDIDENLRLKSKTKQTISKLAQPKSVFVHKNTILSSIQGSIGRVALTQYDCYADRTIAIFTNLKPQIDSIFFLYSLDKLFKTKAKGARGSTIKTITKEEFNDFIIHIPTLAEQKKIAQVLSACDKEIELLKSKFQCLKTQKKGLMQRLLNGKVRVKC